MIGLIQRTLIKVSASEKSRSIWEAHALFVLVGLASLILFTQLLFLLGFSISRIHLLVYFITGFGITFVYWCDIRKAAKTTFSNLLYLAAALFICSWFIDLGGDGMGGHQEAILGLSSEWNPHKDPYFEKFNELKGKYPKLRELPWGGKGTTSYFSYQISAALNKFTGIHESGKAINWLGVLMSFSTSLFVFAHWIRSKIYLYGFCFAWAFNPVSAYQLLTYWQDGFVSSLLATIIAISLYLAWRPKHLFAWLIFFFGIIVLSGCKKSGIGFSALICAALFSWILIRHFSIKQKLVLAGAMLIMAGILLIGGRATGIWGYNRGILDDIQRAIVKYNSDAVWYGESSFNQISEFVEMNRWEVLFYSSFSRTLPVAYEIDLMPVFLTDWEELRVIYYFFEDSRSGGFGAFFRTALILSLLGLLFHIWGMKNRFIVILGMIIIFLPCFFLPTYWARWIPQVSLLPLLFVLPFLMERSNRKRVELFKFNPLRIFSFYAPMIGFGYAFLNSLAIVSLYTIGNVFGTYTVRQQLSVVDKLDQPVSMGTGWFPSNRNWLIDRDIPYKIEWHVEPYALQLYRTNSFIYISDEELQKPYNNLLTIEQKIEAIKSSVDRYQKNQWLNDVFMDKRESLDQ